MGIEWLETVCGILNRAGIPAGEAYPAGRMGHITGPVACVSLEGVEPSEGKILVEARILSPRELGAWRCQEAAVQAMSALETEGIGCRVRKCQHLAGSDCYAVTVSATVIPDPQEEPIPSGSSWSIRMDGAVLSGIVDFSAEQDRGRRLVGAVSRATPVAVTPGKGGWSIRLVQKIGSGVVEAEPLEEPFVLAVTQDGVTEVYSGCYWNHIQRSHGNDGLKVVRKGFALAQEVTQDG